MTPELVWRWLESGELDLPAPGSGQTARRWLKLAALTERDVVAGRLAEAHTDATAILAELGGPAPAAGQLWGVWAAESDEAVVTVTEDGGAAVLDGTKPWCSGAGLCTHALITARRADNVRGLYAVELSQPQVIPLTHSWRNAGMRGSDTRSVQLCNAAAVPVGRPGEYLDRAGFWHGAMAVAACWLGGARGVAGPLYRAIADEHNSASGDVHAHAHLGAIDAALAAGEAMLLSAACYVDAEPHGDRAELMARRVRAVVEHAADEVITRTGRALGPKTLALDGEHAQRVADLTLYVRQSHAERDLAVLGRLAAK
ncbi:acyl-CoA dehydrogenase [Mycobacterium sp. AZCC_0083]|uniref:acyl-CoA dehydrogenase n=1 Tax=Mycobacterium sp. AZCC_0083 TaxID=2735882 RepID=UPI001619B65A|nr:acyl-CoA dehydrogenase [Mycobacterium sp. AZCC_0083]MBB5162636.1 alkylation response protein AidB-like acyl-CoA dehydrogenase [Mycobacterium sp. AZCC_0083]